MREVDGTSGTHREQEQHRQGGGGGWGGLSGIRQYAFTFYMAKGGGGDEFRGGRGVVVPQCGVVAILQII